VIDVEAVEHEGVRAREPREDVERRDRVDAAREREGQLRAAGNVARELRGDACGEVTWRSLP
jgi:hypothetical protein